MQTVTDRWQYPLLLSYQGQPELELITNPAAFAQLELDNPFLLPDADRLIDLQGQVYQCNSAKQWYLCPPQLDLAAVTELLQQHFFACAQSCVLKIQPPDIASAFSMLTT